MKIGKLKKRSLKELEAMSMRVEKMRVKMEKSFERLLRNIDVTIGELEALTLENKSKKVKRMKGEFKETIILPPDVKKRKKG